MTMMKNLIPCILLFMIFASCSSNTASNAIIEDSDSTKVLSWASDPDVPLIQKNLELHLKAQAEGDFVTFTRYAYPRLFETMDKAEVIKTMETYRTEGMIQEMKLIQMKYVSPVVSDSLYKFRLIKFDGIMTIQFSQNYGTDPKAFYNMLKDEHGEEFMVYDEEKKKYTIEREFPMYATCPLDSSDWTFLNYTYTTMPGSGQIFPFEVVRQLKTFEK